MHKSLPAYFEKDAARSLLRLLENVSYFAQEKKNLEFFPEFSELFSERNACYQTDIKKKQFILKWIQF